MSEKKRLKDRLEHSERRRSRIQRLLITAPGEDDPFMWGMVDIMTLLLIFFILMYASMSNKVSAQTVEHRTEPHKEIISGTEPERDLHEDVEDLLEANEDLHVRWERSQPVFVLDEHITFEQGQADLIPDSLPVLSSLADFLARQSQYRVMVTGHTDDVPIQTSRFPSNWELSSARAASVVRFLCSSGIEPKRLSVQGYGEYAPFVGNTSALNRQANRRVEISLVKDRSRVM